MDQGPWSKEQTATRADGSLWELGVLIVEDDFTHELDAYVQLEEHEWAGDQGPLTATKGHQGPPRRQTMEDVQSGLVSSSSFVNSQTLKKGHLKKDDMARQASLRLWDGQPQVESLAQSA
ncbi:hypothetical protein E4U54_002819 [Claviceps lovelessii]|nr:hypothetical protein E4U54_002819 [Claviceps lovelessii]